MRFRDVTWVEKWQYRVSTVEELDLEGKNFTRFFRLWHSKIVDGKLPARRDFAFEDFRDLYGWVLITKTHYNPFDMEATLQGTELRDLEGGDYTGRRNSEFFDDPVEGQHQIVYTGLHEESSAHPEALLLPRCVGPAFANFRNCGAEWISMPCADDGRTVTHFISVAMLHTISSIEGVRI